jgi:hypothetical protein
MSMYVIKRDKLGAQPGGSVKILAAAIGARIYRPDRFFPAFLPLVPGTDLAPGVGLSVLLGSAAGAGAALVRRTPG